MSELFDVIEVELAAPHRIRLLDQQKRLVDAEAIVKFAVIRRGVEHHFYATCPTGKYKDGDTLATPKATGESGKDTPKDLLHRLRQRIMPPRAIVVSLPDLDQLPQHRRGSSVSERV